MPSSPSRSRWAWGEGEELTKSPAPDGAGFFTGELQFIGAPLSRPLGTALKRLEGRSTPGRNLVERPGPGKGWLRRLGWLRRGGPARFPTWNSRALRGVRTLE